MTASALIRLSLVLGTALFAFANAATLTCPLGYDEFLGKCYKLNITHTRWKEAKARCALDGSKLVEPRNQAEFDLIENFGKAVNNIWLGISDLDTEGIFVYASDHQNLTYENWATRQPDDWQNNEDCVHFQAANAGDVAPMNDIDCNTHWFAYVCETEKRSSECAPCPLAGYRPLTTHKCYKLVEDGTTWEEAIKACNLEAPNIAKLAEPRSKVEFDLFDNIFGRIGHNIWLGISDRQKEGTFVYQSDGSNLTFPNWGREQPDDWQANEDCVHYQAPGGRVAPMNDLDCTTNWFSRVCESEISSSQGELNKLLIFDVNSKVFDVTNPNARCNPLPPIPFISQEDTIAFGAVGVGTIIGGKLLLCERHTFSGDCYFYDGCNGGWSVGPKIPTSGRMVAEQSTAVMLDDKRWWVTGESNPTDGIWSDIETYVYHADNGTFERYIDLPSGGNPDNPYFAKLGQNKVLVYMGLYEQTTYLFDIATERLTQVPQPPTNNSYVDLCATITLPDGSQEALITFGNYGNKRSTIFSLSTMEWRTGPDLPDKINHLRGGIVGSDLYIRHYGGSRLFKLNTADMVWEETGHQPLVSPSFELSLFVGIPETFAVCS